MPRPLPPATNQAFHTQPALPLRARALAIHGYTGTPWEVLPVSLALADLGVATTGIVLPGHEGDPTALNRTAWQQWDQAGEAAFAALPTDLPRVLVASSMGSLVALRIAARHPKDVAAVVLMAPALRLFAHGSLAASLSARGLWRLKPFIAKALAGGDIADEDARAMNLSYAVLPLFGVGQLGLFQAVVEAELPLVTAPLCLLHGAKDHTIPPLASEIVALRVGSDRVEHHVLRDSWHVIGVDVDRDQVCAIAASFVAEQLAAAGAPS